MKICRVCLQSDILCAGCSRKLEDNKITNTDVALSRAVHKLGKEKSFDVDFLHSEESGGKIFVVVDSRHAAKFIGPGGKNIKKLAELLGKQIKLLEKSGGTEKQMLEKLIGAPILGINKVYSGVESYKVRVERRYIRTVQPLANIVEKVLWKKVSFVFE